MNIIENDKKHENNEEFNGEEYDEEYSEEILNRLFSCNMNFIRIIWE